MKYVEFCMCVPKPVCKYKNVLSLDFHRFITPDCCAKSRCEEGFESWDDGCYSNRGCIVPRCRGVTAITSSSQDMPVEVQWFNQERATHKPKWLRFFLPGNTSSCIRFSDILLYDFDLTQKGSLKKRSREYLQKQLLIMSFTVIQSSFCMLIYNSSQEICMYKKCGIAIP